MKHPPAHSWVEVSERALVHNIRAHRRLIGPKVKLMAVVKSNAYGHGLTLTARVAVRSRQVDWLGVASLSEALALREADITLPILVLSYFRPFTQHELTSAISRHISLVVYETEQLRALEKAARRAGKPAMVHLKLETGMARLGVMPKEAAGFLHKISQSPYLTLEGIASHLATAESKDQSYLKRQLEVYEQFMASAGNNLGANLLKHIACSAAISAAPASHQSLVRLGIALYGQWPSDDNRLTATKLHPSYGLKPAIAWKTQVIEVQQLPPNTAVGYDRTFVTKRPTTMAALPVGYWDGLDRKLSNKGSVLVRGHRAPIIGRVCMNVTMVDVTGIKSVKPGDEVLLIGRQGAQQITADEIAAATGTINYEVITRINPLLPRILI